jgi:hypothetical protein
MGMSVRRRGRSGMTAVANNRPLPFFVFRLSSFVRRLSFFVPLLSSLFVFSSPQGAGLHTVHSRRVSRFAIPWPQVRCAMAPGGRCVRGRPAARAAALGSGSTSNLSSNRPSRILRSARFAGASPLHPGSAFLGKRSGTALERAGVTVTLGDSLGRNDGQATIRKETPVARPSALQIVNRMSYIVNPSSRFWWGPALRSSNRES